MDIYKPARSAQVNHDFRLYMLKPTTGKVGTMLPLRAGMGLSIQAGKRSYSEPRVDGLSPYEYESFEVAIFNNSHDWLNPFMEDDMKLKPWSNFWSEYEDIAGWVPAEVVQQIYDDLREPDETW